MKQFLPNIFQGTAFKKRVLFLIDAKDLKVFQKCFSFFHLLQIGKQKLIDGSTMLIYIQLIVYMMILKIMHLTIQILSKTECNLKN